MYILGVSLELLHFCKISSFHGDDMKNTLKSVPYFKTNFSNWPLWTSWLVVDQKTSSIYDDDLLFNYYKTNLPSWPLWTRWRAGLSPLQVTNAVLTRQPKPKKYQTTPLNLLCRDGCQRGTSACARTHLYWWQGPQVQGTQYLPYDERWLWWFLCSFIILISVTRQGFVMTTNIQ